MKNAVIALLSLALCFFVLQSLGAFRFGSGLDRNYRDHFVERRIRGVERAPCWVLTIGDLREEPISRGVLEGVRCAVDLINAAGGVLGRPLRLEVAATGADMESHRRLVQSFCDLPEAAVYFGPTHTSSVPAVRALSRFQGLPCIAPMTPADPLLAPLSPDNYVSLYPPLSLWADTLARALAVREPDKVLLVSPDEGSYGRLFADACERSLRHSLPQAEIFRFNYAAPLDDEELRYFVQLYDENRGLDAIVFAGEADDFLACARTQRALKLRLPVYGSDLLDLPDEKKRWQSLPFPLFVPHCELTPPSPAFVAACTALTGSAPTVWNMLGAQAVLLTARALNDDGGYHPDRLAARMRELVDEHWRAHPPSIRLISFGADAE